MSLIFGNQVVTDVLTARLGALTPKLYQEIISLLLGAGVVGTTLLTPHGSDISIAKEYIVLVENSGVKGDRHCYPTAVVDGREDVLRFVMGFPKGTPMANLRQVTIVGQEESDEVARLMDVGGGMLYAGLQMENLIISGFPNLSGSAPRTIVTFFSPTGEPRTATLHIIAPNAPCGHPDKVIRDHYQVPKTRQPYSKAAENRRGLVAAVKTGGRVYPGDIAVFWEHN